MNEWNGTKMKVNVDHIFENNITLYVIGGNEDHELKSINGYRKRKYLQIERDNFVKSNSLCKAKLLDLVRTLEDVKLIRYIQIFARKRIILIKYICIEFDMFTGNLYISN